MKNKNNVYIFDLNFEKIYIILFITMFFWAIMAYTTMTELIDKQKIYSTIINKSGMQRMLSQRTLLLLKQIIENNKEDLIDELEKSIFLMKNNHEFLLNSLVCKEVENVYLKEPYELDKNTKEYFKNIQKALILKDKKLLNDIEIESPILLDSLNYAVTVFERDSKRKIQQLKTTEIWIFIGIFVTLLIEAMFLIIPTMKDIKRKKEALESINKSLEKKIKDEVNIRINIEKKLIQQSKKAEISNMLNNIIDQYKEPLNIISLLNSSSKVNVELENIDKKNLLKNLKEVQEKIDLMSKNLNDFGNFFSSKNDQEDFIIKKSIDKIVRLLSSKFESTDVNLQNNTTKDIIIKGIASEFEQVILNILNNALDVFTNKKMKNKKLISINTTQTKKNIKVKIQDNGGGIPKELLPNKIFTEYISTKEDGTGVGLSICKKIIQESFDGEIEVYNDNDGAVFLITLNKIR